jgi:dihydroorotate dehydrogenase (fumarate)
LVRRQGKNLWGTVPALIIAYSHCIAHGINMTTAMENQKAADNMKRMEEAGASAIVLHSLFEEHLTFERHQLHHHFTHGTESYAEALTYWPEVPVLAVGPESYLEEIVAAKEATSIPIIASLKCSTVGGWTDYAKLVKEAGADAPVGIPVAVKLSPFFSNVANMAKELVEAGAKGLVLFNRFYQPDIDLESLDITPNILLSTPMAMRLPLRWIAILRDRIKADLAATSGVHRATDVIKLLLAGADVTMLCSVLLRHGIDHLAVIEREVKEWMEKHEYESVEQMKGSMSQKKCANPTAFERAQYIRGISTSWRTVSSQ